LKEAIMNAPVSVRAITAEPAPRTRVERPYAAWALVVVLVAVACTVLVLDSSLMPEQRIELLMQSGIFP
jgi:hypothetical protein